MAKKVIIEVRSPDAIELKEAEIFRYGGFVFGLHWRADKYGITATELSTGMTAGSISYQDSRSPRKDLVNRLKKLVDNGEMKQGVERGLQSINQRLLELQNQEALLRKVIENYKLPLNAKFYKDQHKK